MEYNIKGEIIYTFDSVTVTKSGDQIKKKAQAKLDLKESGLDETLPDHAYEMFGIMVRNLKSEVQYTLSLEEAAFLGF